MEHQKKGLNDMYGIVKKFADSMNVKSVFFYVLVISLLEVLAYSVGKIFATIESVVWMASGVICFAIIFYWFCKNIICDFKKKDYISVIGILLLLAFFNFFVGNINYSDINPDATQQMAAGISSFEQWGWNFTGSAFLGYPNRQYLIAALPSLVLRRSIYTLHMGFAFPFFAGLIMMYLGLREWCQKYEVSNKIALLAVYSLLAFRFVAEYFMNFEQAITPISITMLALGLFLKFVNRPTALCLNLIVWVGTFAAGSYTPVWASLGLLIAFLVLYAWDVYKNRREENNKLSNSMEIIKSVCCAVIGIVIVTITILTHTKPEKMEQTREEIAIGKFIFECIRDFFFDKDAVFFGGIGIVVLAYLLLALMYQLKIRDFVIAIWVLVVVVLANYMTGYTTYQKCWILQRTLIIVPVLIVGITLTVMPYLKKIQKPKWFVFLAMVCGMCGIYNFNQPHQSFTYFSYIQPMKYMLYTTADILEEEEIDVEDEFNLVFYTDNQLETNVECYTRFLYPGAHTYVGACSEMVQVEDASLPTIIFSNETSIGEKYNETVLEYKYFEQRYNTEIAWQAIVHSGE